MITNKPIYNYPKNKIIIISLVLISVVFLQINLHSQQNEYDLIYNEFTNWDNIEVFKDVYIHTSGIEDGSITLAENRNGPNKYTELMLSFDYDNQGNWQDLNNLTNYELLDREFLVSYNNKRHGASSARFYRLMDYVSLMPNDNSIFTTENSAGSFSIDFWIYFYNTYNNQTIFEKKGQAIRESGEAITSGISSRLYNNRIEVSFRNIFYHLSSLLSDNPFSENEITLNSSETIVPEKWYHVAISFDEYSGLLALYTNGIMQESIWCTDNGTSRGEIYIPRFYEEDSPLIIGSGINGLLDDFHIQRKSVNNIALSKYKKTEGIIKSEIIDLNYDGSSISSLLIESSNTHDSDVVFEFRISSEYFLPDTSIENMRWIDYSIIDEVPDNLLKGRYLQWRLRLLPGYLYEYSPIIDSINIDINYNYPPSKVLGLEAESRNGLLLLSWDGNIEQDIDSYKIYYGEESKNYLEEGSIISIAKSQLVDPINPSYSIRGLDKDKVYYISITAVDKYGIESEFSEEISIRIKY